MSLKHTGEPFCKQCRGGSNGGTLRDLKYDAEHNRDLHGTTELTQDRSQTGTKKHLTIET